MIKPKGAGTLLGIILISATGWAALVTFVLAPNLLVRAALSLGGGVAIAVAVAFLLRRWCGFGRAGGKGITFIEVLIVLAILAILAAILVPNLLRIVGG